MGIVALPMVGVFILLALFAGEPNPRRLTKLGAILLVLGMISMSLFSVAVAMALFAAAATVVRLRPSPLVGRRVVAGWVIATLIVLLIPMTGRVVHRLRLREQYAFNSLKSKVVPSNEDVLIVRGGPAPESKERFRTPFYLNRSRAIAYLHRSAVSHFLETPEFGVTRMLFPNLRNLENQDGSPIRLPTRQSPTYRPHLDSSPLARQFGQVATDLEVIEPLSNGHDHYASWFLDENRFGLIEDLDHVAGFQSHAVVDSEIDQRWNADELDAPFHQADDGITNQFSLVQLQLVGLLYHETPVVYVLETLPELLTADTAPTRQLDAFENRGLKALLEGRPVHVEQDEVSIRMLGALRSSSECAQCHEGPADQLLGAFSYVLRSNEEPPATPGTGFPLSANLLP